jgi:hypothetical protein
LTRPHCAAVNAGYDAALSPSKRLPGMRPLPVRIRKLIGAVALVALVIVWSLLAMALAQAVALRESPTLEFAFYVVAGIGWVLPAMPLVSWMSRVTPC